MASYYHLAVGTWASVRETTKTTQYGLRNGIVANFRLHRKRDIGQSLANMKM